MTGARAKRRGGVLDLLLILLIVLSITGLLWRRYMSEREGSWAESFSYSVYAQSEAMDAMSFDSIQKGDWLYTPSGEPFGEIMAIERTAAEVLLISDGILYRGAWDADVRCAARVEIRVSGRPTEHGVLVSASRITAGGALPTLYSPFAALRLTVYKLEVDEPR